MEEVTVDLELPRLHVCLASSSPLGLDCFYVQGVGKLAWDGKGHGNSLFRISVKSYNFIKKLWLGLSVSCLYFTRGRQKQHL